MQLSLALAGYMELGLELLEVRVALETLGREGGGGGEGRVGEGGSKERSVEHRVSSGQV